MSSRGNGTGGTSSQEGTGDRMDTRSAAETSGGQAVEEQEFLSVQTVFGQQELLEHILGYAIHDENVETLKAVRLVSRSWLTGVTNVLRRNKEPLFKLKLTKGNSLMDSPDVEAQGKLLERFAQSVENRLAEPFPTFSLRILKEFFRRENYDHLVDFLRQCARGLVELTMIIPEHGGSLPGVLPIVDLPSLQKLVPTFTDEKAADNMSGTELDFGHSTNVICLIQSFLSKAHSLKEFSVPLLKKEEDGRILGVLPAPRGFEFVNLPECITSLYLNCPMASEQLDLLLRNKLPNLLNLRLLLQYMSCAGLLSKMLANFCEHLRSLTVLGTIYNGPPRITNFVRFSEMKTLTCLTTTGVSTFELQDHHPMLNKCFPKLETLNVLNQTPEMLRKWTMGTPLHSVKSLYVSLVDENKSERSRRFVLPINLESMQSIHLAFPNVVKLYLILSTGRNTQACGLKYLFTEMKQLTSLYIEVRGSGSITNSDHWDSIFTGAPISVVAGLRESPDYWSHFELKDSTPCIKMLTALKTLTLKALVEGTDAQATQPLISDLTFVFALLKMGKLKDLTLYGRFLASDLMTETWRKDGRSLEYFASD